MPSSLALQAIYPVSENHLKLKKRRKQNVSSKKGKSEVKGINPILRVSHVDLSAFIFSSKRNSCISFIYSYRNQGVTLVYIMCSVSTCLGNSASGHGRVTGSTDWPTHWRKLIRQLCSSIRQEADKNEIPKGRKTQEVRSKIILAFCTGTISPATVQDGGVQSEFSGLTKLRR